LNNFKINVAVTGTGAALPEQRVTNQDLERMVETSDEWIVSRTGIRERRKLESALSSADLATAAAAMALKNAGLDAGALDLILVATVTPDHMTPSTACLLQDRLGAGRAAAMDLSAGCTGFIYALTTGYQFILSGACRCVLVVGVEVLSRVTDWEDRATCVLFGDGAGAVVLQPVQEDRGLITFELGADGSGAGMLLIPAGGSKYPASAETVQKRLHYVRMNGNEVFKFAVRAVEDTLATLLQRGGVTSGQLDYLFLHQANLRIIESARKRLNLSPDRVPVHIDRYGNMSSAAIPITMHEEAEAGRLNKGDLLAAIAFGAGLTWGGVLMRW
jgi:3-oxoacyl-[acyl-carrier-protein] synthase-3